MRTKVTATLLLAAAALLVSAGCGHQETAPAAPVATGVPVGGAGTAPAGGGAPAPVPASPDEGAAKALSNPNTPPEAKSYIRDHQNPSNQGQARPPGGP